MTPLELGRIMDIDERVDSLYKLARKNPDNSELQDVVEIVKFLRRSQGSLQGWNERYRQEKGDLKLQIDSLNAELESLNSEVSTLTRDRERMSAEREKLNAEMLDLTESIAKRTAEKERAIAELKNVEREVKMAARNVRETRSIFGKFTILWTLLRSLFLDEEWEDFGAIDNRLPTDPDKPQMGSGQADNNRSLLDK
ncbi:hypothetical protein [Pannus brasiliensis]|uniref:coiled-coil domain-containing protein n=1 Tax=Pannus brasiliensis TaxID=1579216 RepID=UPI002FCDD094